MKRIMFISTLALTLSSCTLVYQSDAEAGVVDPRNIKVWYCPTDQRTYDFSFQVDSNIHWYEAILMPRGKRPIPTEALGHLTIRFASPLSGTERNSISVDQDKTGYNSLAIVVKPKEPYYDLYVRTLGERATRYSDYVLASNYIDDCR